MGEVRIDNKEKSIAGKVVTMCQNNQYVPKTGYFVVGSGILL